MTARRISAPRWNNCLLWAIALYAKKGGYIIIRRSHRTRLWCPHILWSRDGRTLWSYSPLGNPQGRWFAPLVFKGHVVLGDEPQHRAPTSARTAWPAAKEPGLFTTTAPIPALVRAAS